MRIKNLGSILVFPTTASDYHNTGVVYAPPPGIPPKAIITSFPFVPF